MKFIFITSSCNWHQKPFSDEMATLTDFTFYETVPPKGFLHQACEQAKERPDYVISTSVQETYHENIQADLVAADTVLVSYVPPKTIRARIKKGKLIFRYAERPLKNGLEPLKYFPRLLRWHFWNPVWKPIYMLCASAYTAADYAKFGLFWNRCYKWGYFPETKTYDVEELLLKKQNEIPKLLWCGRFLDWKHPDDAICAVERLKREGYRFTLDFIGAGELLTKLEQMIHEKGLGDCVRLLGTMNPEQVREHMEQANIYLFTSDRYEGWGAVLNESMNSGCAVVASHAIGSVPFLLKDGENGLIYESGNVDMLYEKVKHLLDHPEEQVRLGRAAYHTIADEWNAQVAAKRLAKLSAHLLRGEKSPDLFTSGPCSRAEYLGDDWFIHGKS